MTFTINLDFQHRCLLRKVSDNTKSNPASKTSSDTYKDIALTFGHQGMQQINCPAPKSATTTYQIKPLNSDDTYFECDLG